MHEELMRKAIQLAVENVGNGGGPFAALVVRSDIVVASGVNEVTRTNDPTAHAEMVAIRGACRKLNSFHLVGCELYTTCEPCPMCLGAAYWARLARVYYGGTSDDAARSGFDDSYIYHQILLPDSERSIPFINLLREEATSAFEFWKQSGSKVPY